MALDAVVEIGVQVGEVAGRRVEDLRRVADPVLLLLKSGRPKLDTRVSWRLPASSNVSAALGGSSTNPKPGHERVKSANRDLARLARGAVGEPHHLGVDPEELQVEARRGALDRLHRAPVRGLGEQQADLLLLGLLLRRCGRGKRAAAPQAPQPRRARGLAASISRALCPRRADRRSATRRASRIPGFGRVSPDPLLRAVAFPSEGQYGMGESGSGGLHVLLRHRPRSISPAGARRFCAAQNDGEREASPKNPDRRQKATIHASYRPSVGAAIRLGMASPEGLGGVVDREMIWLTGFWLADMIWTSHASSS